MRKATSLRWHDERQDAILSVREDYPIFKRGLSSPPYKIILFGISDNPLFKIRLSSKMRSGVLCQGAYLVKSVVSVSRADKKLT